MTAQTYTEMAAHIGHTPSVVTYADGANVALECCGEVLLDFDRPGDAAPGTGGQLWHDNSVQFPRLIAEMNAAGFFDAEVPVIENKLELLTRSTDLDVDDVMELVDRAQTWWDRYLEARREHEQGAGERPAHPVDALPDEARHDLLAAEQGWTDETLGALARRFLADADPQTQQGFNDFLADVQADENA